MLFSQALADDRRSRLVGGVPPGEIATAQQRNSETAQRARMAVVTMYHQPIFLALHGTPFRSSKQDPCRVPRVARPPKHGGFNARRGASFFHQLLAELRARGGLRVTLRI